MKVLAMIGDSHTWGQGVGAEVELEPSVVGGDLRMTSFSYPGYVNLLRERINSKTNSRACEYRASEINASSGIKKDGCLAFPCGKVTITADFSLARLFVRVLSGSPVKFHLTLDGKSLPDVVFSSDNDNWNESLFPIHFLAENDGTHVITVSTENTELMLYRLECYEGNFAVVNCAVGSCPVEKYLSIYYDRYVSPLCPYGALFEGCTINDWLTGEETQVYAKLIRTMIMRLKENGIKVLCHTVLPVAGKQTFGNSLIPYIDYVKAMRSAILETGAELVDCDEIFHSMMKGMPEEEYKALFYSDIWHPNVKGHSIYANEIYPVLEQIMLN